MTLRTRIDDFYWTARSLALVAVERVETGIVFNPLAPGLRVDPYPFYRRLRESDPFHRSRAADGWVLTRYDDVLAVLRDRAFSSDERHTTLLRRMAGAWSAPACRTPTGRQQSMLRIDPPDHTRLRDARERRPSRRARSSACARASEQVVEGAARGAGPRTARWSWCAEFAAPLPVSVIAEMLGVPVDDRERFRHWSDEAVRSLGDGTLRRPPPRAARDWTELRSYFGRSSRSAARQPREDLLSALVAAEEAATV